MACSPAEAKSVSEAAGHRYVKGTFHSTGLMRPDAAFPASSVAVARFSGSDWTRRGRARWSEASRGRVRRAGCAANAASDTASAAHWQRARHPTRPAGVGCPHTRSCPQSATVRRHRGACRRNPHQMDRPPPLIELMRAQDGLITRGQALRCGLSRDQVRYRCSLGEWVAVYPGVFRFASTPVTVRSSIRAAGLWVGPPGWVSGIAALYWWGLSDKPSSDVEVTVPRRRFLRPPSGIAIRRSDLQVADTTVLDGLSVTH